MSSLPFDSHAAIEPFAAPDSLNLLVCKRNFEAVKWLYYSRPQDYFIDIQLTSCSHRCRLGLDDIQWVAWLAFEVAWGDQWRRLVWIDGVNWSVVRAGDLALLEVVYDIRKVACVSDEEEERSPTGMNLTEEAALLGHLAIVQWLFNHQTQCCTTTSDGQCSRTRPFGSRQVGSSPQPIATLYGKCLGRFSGQWPYGDGPVAASESE